MYLRKRAYRHLYGLRCGGGGGFPVCVTRRCVQYSINHLVYLWLIQHGEKLGHHRIIRDPGQELIETDLIMASDKIGMMKY